MNEEERTTFLETPRLGILMMNRDPAPVGVPVWFEWTGDTVEMFSMNTAPKIRRITTDPNASVLAVNSVGEPEAWVAFDGAIAVTNPGGLELAERLAERYWDMSLASNRKTLAAWKQHPETMCQLTLTPSRIRSS